VVLTMPAAVLRPVEESNVVRHDLRHPPRAAVLRGVGAVLQPSLHGNQAVPSAFPGLRGRHVLSAYPAPRMGILRLRSARLNARSEQRPLPRLMRRQYQPRQRPAHGLRRLPLVTPERQLIPVVLLPRPGLTPDGRRVLACLYNRVPLRPGRKRLGHGLLDDLLQGHTGPSPTASSAARHVALGMVSAPDITLSPSRENLTTCLDRKSTRLNSSHVKISYAVFCLKKKKYTNTNRQREAK